MIQTGGKQQHYFHFQRPLLSLYAVVLRVVKHILRNYYCKMQNAKGMFTKPVQKIIYAYSEYQNIFDDMKTTNPGIIFH